MIPRLKQPKNNEMHLQMKKHRWGKRELLLKYYELAQVHDLIHLCIDGPATEIHNRMHYFSKYSNIATLQ